MKQEGILELPVERQHTQAIPQTHMASIRYMFHEMNSSSTISLLHTTLPLSE